MSCEIKNENCPFQIECIFPQTKGSFALYFYPFQGSPEQVVGCAYNGHHKCFNDEGFNVNHTGYNNVIITVPDTFATRKGSFGCHKGDIPIATKCPYPPPETCKTTNNIKSGIGLGATTNAHKPFLPRSEDSGAEDTNLIIGSVVGAVSIIVVIVLIILLFRRYKQKKSPRCPEKPHMDEGSVSEPEENEKIFMLGHVNNVMVDNEFVSNNINRKEKDVTRIDEKEPFLGNEENEKNAYEMGSEKKSSDKTSDNTNDDEGFEEKGSDDDSEEKSSDRNSDESNDEGFEGKSGR